MSWLTGSLDPNPNRSPYVLELKIALNLTDEQNEGGEVSYSIFSGAEYVRASNLL